jgi:hypothetical protein
VPLGKEHGGAFGDAVDDFVEVEPVGGDDEIGGFLLEGAAFFEQFGDGAAGVGGVEEGAFLIV